MIFVVKEEDKGLYREIKGRIRRLQSGGTLDSIARLGIDTAGQNGASFFSLRDLARCYEKNQVVARMLWGDHLREEQIVALFLLPDLSENSPDEKNSCVAVKNFATAEEEAPAARAEAPATGMNAPVTEIESHTENGKAVTREIEPYREKEKAVSKGIDSFAEEEKAFVAEVNALVAEAVSLEVAEYAGSQWIAGLRNCEEILCANFEISSQLLPLGESKTTKESSMTPTTKTKAPPKSKRIDESITTTESSTTPVAKTNATSKSERIDNNETQTTPSTANTTATSPVNAQLLVGVAMIGAAARLIATKSYETRKRGKISEAERERRNSTATEASPAIERGRAGMSEAPEIAKQWILRHYDNSYLEMLAERQRIRL